LFGDEGEFFESFGAVLGGQLFVGFNRFGEGVQGGGIGLESREE